MIQMFKSLSLMLLAAALLAVPSSLKADSPGVDQVHQIQQGYQQGQFDGFLRQLNSDYNRQKGSRWVKEAMEVFQQGQQQGGMPPQGQGDQQQAGGEPPEGMKEMQQLLEERNSALDEVCNGGNSPICQRLVGLKNMPQEQSAGSELSQQLLFSPPSRGDRFFNDLREIEEESYIKNMILMGGENGEPSQNLNPENLIVLEMDKWSRMRELAGRMPNHPLSRKVMQASDEAFNGWVAMIDGMYLQGLGSGQVRPQDPQEQKIAEILKDFGGRAQKLMESFQQQGGGDDQYGPSDDRQQGWGDEPQGRQQGWQQEEEQPREYRRW